MNFDKLKGLRIDVRVGDIVLVNEDLKIQVQYHKSSNGFSLVFDGPKEKYKVARLGYPDRFRRDTGGK